MQQLCWPMVFDFYLNSTFPNAPLSFQLHSRLLRLPPHACSIPSLLPGPLIHFQGISKTVLENNLPHARFIIQNGNACIIFGLEPQKKN